LISGNISHCLDVGVANNGNKQVHEHDGNEECEDSEEEPL
jgi:hypothetical protein